MHFVVKVVIMLDAVQDNTLIISKVFEKHCIYEKHVLIFHYAIYRRAEGTQWYVKFSKERKNIFKNLILK